MFALWGTQAAAWLWNNMVMGHIEEELPDYQRRQFHINLWKGEDGSNHIFLRGATSPEFQSSLGMDGEFFARGLRMFTGDVTLGEFAATTGETFLNHWGQMKGPYISLAYAAMGLDTYPSILEPRRVKDRTKEMFDAIGMGEEYAALMGKPSRWSDRYIGGEDVLFQTYEPGLNAYNRIRDEVREYREKVLEKYGYQGGMATGRRADALYFMKQAIKYKDPDQAEYFMLEYVSTFAKSVDGKLKIDPKEIERALTQSSRMRSPLGMLAKDDVPGFLINLVPENDRASYKKSLPKNLSRMSQTDAVKAMVENLPEPHRSNILKAEEYYKDFQLEPLREAYKKADKRARSGELGNRE
tara:strand:+ start:125 stop:1189 length:1065 start_codon:yes stop_codon:yes gene_type:complete